jgi:hypothetical protein
MNKTTMVMETYEAPKAEVIEVEVEKGFAASAEPLGERYKDFEW